jgi:hypothetical protein
LKVELAVLLGLRYVKSGEVTVKVTGKKNGKKVSKSLKLTVKTVAAKLAISASDVTVGSTANVSVTKKVPAAATVTYTSSDEKVATVDASGVVTGVASGTATITATSDYGVTDSVTINVGKYAFESVKQTKTTELVATIKGATSEIKSTDFTITNTATNATVPVKTVKVDKKDATKVTITTFGDMKDGKDYNVVLDNVTRSFTATDGTVASVGLSKTEVAAGEETTVQAQSIDANGVVIGEFPITSTNTGKGDVSVDLTISKGYASGKVVYLPSVGDTMTAKLTYHTGTFGTDGNETGAITQDFTITAVDPSVVDYTFAVTITGKENVAPAWTATSFKANTAVKIDTDAYAYFRILKDDGTEITNYNEYTVKSADKTKLLVNEVSLKNDAKSNYAEIKGVSEGTTYIEIYKDDNVVGTVSVTVSGAPVATTLDIDKTNITVVSGTTVSGTAILQAYDQYGDKRTTYKVTKAVCVGAPSGVTTTDVPDLTISDDKDSVSIDGYTLSTTSGLKTGSYTYKITVVDGKVTLTRSLTVTLVDQSTSVKYELVATKSKIDTTIGSDAITLSDYNIDLNVYAVMNGGLFNVTGSSIEYTLKNSSGKTLAVVGKDAKTETVTCDAIAVTTAAITGNNDKLTINTVTGSSGKYIKALEAGTYTVSAKFSADGGDKDTYASTSFTVVDDNVLTASYKWTDEATEKGTVSFASVSNFVNGFADEKLINIYYDGVVQELDASDIAKVVGKSLSNGGAFIDKIYVYVTVTGSTTNKLLVPVKINDQIADCSGSDISAE